ncbi:MAG: tetratricopeptide repeat protein [Candidatus Delongbacteria bacterium]|nr:tetratricopeptide repeat protein [Candidatus Delongbacteria bacterium]
MSGISDAQKARQWFTETLKIHRSTNPDLQKVIAGYRKSLKYAPHDPEVLYTLGVAYLGRGEVSHALEEIDKSLSIKDDVAEAWFHHGQCHMLLKQYDKAEVSYRHALRLTPTERSATLHFALAMTFQARNQADKAIAAFRTGLEISPDDLSGNFQFAILLLNTGKADEAAQRLDSLLEKQPGNRDVLNYRALIHAQKQEYGQGAALLQKAIELNGNDAALLFNLGQMQEQGGDRDTAETSYRESLELKRDQPPVLGRLAMLLAGHKKEYDAAIALFDEALALAPNDAGLHYLKGMAYQEQGETDIAVKLVERALELQPGLREAQLALERLKQGGETAGPSSSQLEEALEKDPENRSLKAQLVQAYMLGQRAAEALPLIEELLKDDPDNHALHLNLGFALSMTAGRDGNALMRARAELKRGLEGVSDLNARYRLVQIDLQLREADEAADELRKLLMEAPEDARLHGMLGTALQQKGHFVDAVAAFTTALEKDPTAREPVVSLAQIHDLLGELEPAVAMYQRWLEFSGKDATPGLRLALLYNRNQQYQNGLAVLDAQLERDPENVQIIFYRALTLMDLRRYDDAEIALNRALELRPEFPEASQRLQHLQQIRPMASASVEELEKSVADDPDDLDDRYLLALSYMTSRDWGKAIGQLEAIVAKDAQNHRALYELANAHVAAGDLDHAIDCMIQLEERLPSDPSVRFRLAELMLENDEVSLALKEYHNAVDMQPNNALFNFRYGIALKEADREDKAEEYIRKALKLQDVFPQAWYELGLLEYTSERHDGALTSFQKSLTQNPQQPQALYFSALIHLNVKKDPALATKLLQSALSLAPAHGDAHFQLGKLFAAAGRDADAGYHLAAALDSWDEHAFNRPEAERLLADSTKS